MNIATGKFELTEWHHIAEEWFKEKLRNSDQVYMYSNYYTKFFNMHPHTHSFTHNHTFFMYITLIKVNASIMLRKGLPRAFPGLDEVKDESIKEGTQYRSRVFQAPPTLVQGQHVINALTGKNTSS